MSFIRGIFLLAFAMLALGIFGSNYLLNKFFGHPSSPNATELAAVAPTASATIIPPTATSVVVVVTVTPASRPTSTVQPSVTPLPTAHISPTPVTTASTRRRAGKTRKAVSSPASGAVSLTRFWVGSPQAPRGATIEVGFVINNQTGHTTHVMLGASIKADRVLTWGASISDPSHDVVAIVPPGVSTHYRYFALPTHLRPGAYDVAWGLRDARTGLRDALAASNSVLRVTG
jgi:hypothetical protein